MSSPVVTNCTLRLLLMPVSCWWLMGESLLLKMSCCGLLILNMQVTYHRGRFLDLLNGLYGSCHLRHPNFLGSRGP